MLEIFSKVSTLHNERSQYLDILSKQTLSGLDGTIFYWTGSCV